MTRTPEQQKKDRLRQEEREREKKRQAEARAAIRKAERTASAARKAKTQEWSENAKAEGAPSKPKTIEEIVADYLESPPYLGSSSRDDKDKVKKLAGGETGNDYVFDSKRKLWGTNDIRAVARLVRSRLWRPLGILEEWYSVFDPMLEERVRAVDTPPPAAQTPAPVPSKTPTKHADNNKSSPIIVPPSSPSAVARCLKLGLTENAIAASGSWIELGPRDGIGDAERAERFLGMSILAGVHAKMETDIHNATSVTERDRLRDLYFNEALLRERCDAEVRLVVESLNARTVG